MHQEFVFPLLLLALIPFVYNSYFFPPLHFSVSSIASRQWISSVNHRTSLFLRWTPPPISLLFGSTSTLFISPIPTSFFLHSPHPYSSLGNVVSDLPTTYTRPTQYSSLSHYPMNFLYNSITAYISNVLPLNHDYTWLTHNAVHPYLLPLHPFTAYKQ